MAKHILLLAVSATFGVAANSSFQIKLFLFILLFFCFLFYRFNGNGNLLLLHLIILLLFFSVAYLSNRIHETVYSGDEKNFLVTFDKPPNIDGNLLKAVVNTDKNEALQLRYMISTEAEKNNLEKNLSIGLSCPINGSLTKPETNRNENSFNYQQYLYHQHIHWVLKADSISWSHCRINRSSIIDRLQNIRKQAILFIHQHFPSESSGFVTALLFGDQTYIDEETLTTYQRLGIVHLLAISGLHVSFLTGLIFYFGIRAGITRERMMVVILFFLPFYAILSGGSPSVVRACCMAMLYFLLLFLKKRVSAITSIGVVYLFLLLIQPNVVYNIGFQLSFGVTLAMMLSLKIVQAYSQKILQLLIISVVCQLAALLILLYHFYEVSILGVFLNILYVPLYSILFLPFSIVALFMYLFFPPLGEGILVLLDKAFRLCNELANIVSSLPYASICFGKPLDVVILLLMMVIFGLFMKWESTSFKKSKYWIYALVFILFFQYHAQKLNPFGEIIFIDVGQGDSILIKLPFNRGNYLIDTGGSIVFPTEEWKKRRKAFTTGEDIILPLLKSKGIHQLDKLILTHPDADHTGSALEILQHIKVKEMVIGSKNEEFFQGKGIIQGAIEGSIPISTVEKGESWQVDNAKFFILNPFRKEKEVNESSIVILAQIGGLTWLFTGDAGESTEKELINTYPTLRVDVLKAGHHGSKSSSSQLFLEAIEPKATVLSVGKDNRYGHPHQQILKSFQDLNIKIFRTDLDGAVTYRYRKEVGTFHTELP